LYRDIVDFALSTPGWVHTFAEVGTDAGLFVFAALFVLCWWRARNASDRVLAVALTGPAGVVGTYVVSEIIKLVIQEDRPCRGIKTVAACPPLDDWSFPSNHSAIAAGSAGALVLAWRALAWFVIPLAAVMAFSRVFVGVHYPHDVAAGFTLGLVLAPVFTLLLVGAATPVVRMLRARVSWAQPADRPQPVRQPQASDQLAGQPQTFDQTVVQPQAFGQTRAFGQSQPYEQQPYEQPQQYGQPQPHDQTRQYGQPQSYGQPQQYGQSQPHDQTRQYGQSPQYGQPQTGSHPHAGSYPQDDRRPRQ
jgi:membrane-associated phospholipid phosphatase